MIYSLQHRPMRLEPSADPMAAPQQALRRAVHELRLETERRSWALRPTRAGGGTPFTLPLDRSPRDAASDPLVALLAQLRAATTRYVYALRADGARPEQVLVQVKGLVRESMSAEGWSDPEATRALTAEVVRWSIDAYYDG